MLDVLGYRRNKIPGVCSDINTKGPTQFLKMVIYIVLPEKSIECIYFRTLKFNEDVN